MFSCLVTNDVLLPGRGNIRFEGEGLKLQYKPLSNGGEETTFIFWSKNCAVPEGNQIIK